MQSSERWEDVWDFLRGMMFGALAAIGMVVVCVFALIAFDKCIDGKIELIEAVDSTNPDYDIDGDGIPGYGTGASGIDLGDALQVLAYFGAGSDGYSNNPDQDLGTPPPDPDVEANYCPYCDVSYDGGVDLSDALLILGEFGYSVPNPRTKYFQPFSATSIWNTPIGDGAIYAETDIPDWDDWGVFPEENYIFNAWGTGTQIDIEYNDDAWAEPDRCDDEGVQVYQDLPLPANFIIAGSTSGSTPNNSAGIIKADGDTLAEMQPLTHCTTTGPWTAFDVSSDKSLAGDGRLGSQGGSHLSGYGGTIRRKEFALGAIRHALKVVMHGPALYDDDLGGLCYRWPATACDSDDSDYAGTSVHLKMGSLLAVAASTNCANVTQTVPGEIICETLRGFGAYVVDATNWGGGSSPIGLAIEHGPHGSVEDEFERLYGFPFSQSDENQDWAEDWRALVQLMMVVTNNASDNIGGGGDPIVTPPPALGD